MKTKTLSIALATIMIFSVLMATVPIYSATKEEIDNAIEDGMAWLANQQNPDGSWGTLTSDRVGRTGLAVVKFETHAIQNNIDPLHPSYQYYNQVRNGLDYIFNNSYTITIGPQTHGDPDGDNDGKGVYFWTSHRVYNTGIAMMAIAASTHPGEVVTVPAGPTCAVSGWKYKDVLQDALDYMAFAQTDSGTYRGGWGYDHSNNASGWSDNSNAGYATLGLGYAQATSPGGFELTIPEFVYNELDVWIEHIQNKNNATLNTPDPVGGSGYNTPDHWVNILKTGNLLYQMWLVGDSVSKPRVQAAMDYLVRHWNDTNYTPGWIGPTPHYNGTTGTGNPACYQAMYTVMKGLEAFGIEEIDGFNWTRHFFDVLVGQQNPDGSWPNAPTFGWSDGSAGWLGADQEISVTFALLTLEKAVPPEPPPGHKEIKEELEAIEAKLDLWLPDIKNEIMMIEGKLDLWLPEIKKEIVMIEEKLDLWLPEIKTEILNIELKLDKWLPEIKTEIMNIEWKLDYIIDKEAVEVEILTGKEVGIGTQILKNRFVYYMMTTVAGQKTSMDKIEIEAEATMLDPATYTVTELKPGVYMIEIDRKAVAEGTRFFVIQVEKYMPCFVVYHGSAFAPAFNVG